MNPPSFGHQCLEHKTAWTSPAPTSLETGKVLTVFVCGDVIVEDRGLLLGVAP